jgi:hypothetical protein
VYLVILLGLCLGLSSTRFGGAPGAPCRCSTRTSANSGKCLNGRVHNLKASVHLRVSCLAGQLACGDLVASQNCLPRDVQIPEMRSFRSIPCGAVADHTTPRGGED